MSLACQVAQGRRSPCWTRVPSGSCRSTVRSSREMTRSRPSGSQPKPPVSPSKGTSSWRSPAGETEYTPWSKKSEYHSRPSCQRGHSPKKRPERNGSAERVSVTWAPPVRIGQQFSTPHLPSASSVHRRYVWIVAYWVLKAVLTPIFFVLFRVKVEGRDNIPKHGAAVLAAN